MYLCGRYESLFPIGKEIGKLDLKPRVKNDRLLLEPLIGEKRFVRSGSEKDSTILSGQPPERGYEKSGFLPFLF